MYIHIYIYIYICIHMYIYIYIHKVYVSESTALFNADAVLFRASIGSFVISRDFNFP